jgi:hypothetical protein
LITQIISRDNLDIAIHWAYTVGQTLDRKEGNEIGYQVLVGETREIY